MYSKVFSVQDKKVVDIEFSHGVRLSHDYVNSFGALHLQMSFPIINWSRIKPVRNYEEYFLSAYPVRYECIVQLSDPVAILELDHLVAVFNSDLPRIKETKDAARIHNFLDEIHTLVRSRR